jgi:NAD+ synthase
MTTFGPAALEIDPVTTTAEITAAIRGFVSRTRRRGAVVALSGGIDSSVVAALCVRALGSDRVLGLHLPERESAVETLALSQLVSDSLGIVSEVTDITAVLEAVGCYARRDEAIRQVYPTYGPGHESKIVLPDLLDSDSFRIYSLVVRDPDGQEQTTRLTTSAYLGVVAATNFKQRVRKMFEYYHADRLNYIATGTPNRLEYDQGFFVKLGDGSGDLKPIAHLYKTQVYSLAEYLDVPAAIRARPSTTDTYSMPQSQAEFYFSLPYPLMDLCLFARNHAIPAPEVAAATGMSEEQVLRVFRDIEQKRRSTEYLHLPPILAGDVPEVG